MDRHVILENFIKHGKGVTLKDLMEREDELMPFLWNLADIRESAKQMYHQNAKQPKSITKARLLKNIGNKQFQAKNYSESVQSYTRCAMYAPEHSPEHSIAFANRSASLFFLNRYKDCIKDIELAIKLDYPEELHYKLHLRKLHCYLKLGNLDLVKEMISKIYELIDDPNYIAPSMKDDFEKRISGITFNGPCTLDMSENSDDTLDLTSILMFDENPNFPNASSSIDRKFNEEQGRHVVANRFIRKGEVLFLEKPISFVFNNDDVIGHFCQHCCFKSDILVPCSKCLNTFYCDTNCLNEAWSSYHCWECAGNQMGLWKENWFGKLALKVLLVCTTMTDTIEFNEMLNLTTNFDKEPIDKLIQYGTIAIMLTWYLLEHTDFFQKNDLNDNLARKFSDKGFYCNFLPITNDNKHLFVSSLLLRYILQLNFNSTLIFEDSMHIYDMYNMYIEIDRHILAGAIYPSASMMNHSCDPNIIINFMDQYLIIRALKDIVANEEILICYGPTYRNLSTEKRQKKLSSLYHFTCKCKPCTELNLKYFLERFTAMKCPKCNGALCNIKNSLFCLDCFGKLKHFRQNKIKHAEKLFNEAKRYIDQENVVAALKKLEKCLNIRRRILYKSNKDIVSTLYFISQLYMAEGKFANAKKCWESVIAAVTERFGPFSVQLINELNRFINVCTAHLRTTSDTTTSSFKDVLTTTYACMEQVEELVDLKYGSWSVFYKMIKEQKKWFANLPSVKASLSITN